MTHYIITGNATRDGAAIYLADQGRWTRKLADACSVSDATQRDSLLALAKSAQKEVCDPYPIEVELVNGIPQALSLRESIRATGPSIPIPTQTQQGVEGHV